MNLKFIICVYFVTDNNDKYFIWIGWDRLRIHIHVDR